MPKMKIQKVVISRSMIITKKVKLKENPNSLFTNPPIDSRIPKLPGIKVENCSKKTRSAVIKTGIMAVLMFNCW